MFSLHLVASIACYPSYITIAYVITKLTAYILLCKISLLWRKMLIHIFKHQQPYFTLDMQRSINNKDITNTKLSALRNLCKKCTISLLLIIQKTSLKKN